MKYNSIRRSNSKTLPTLMGLGAFLFCYALLLGGCGASLEPQTDGETDLFDQTRFKIDRLRAQPIGKGNVRVSIQRLEMSEKRRRVHSLLTSYRDKEASLSAGPLGGRNGLFLYGLRKDWSAGWTAAAKKYQSARQTRQFLVLMVGTRGAISVTERRTRPMVVSIPIWDGTRTTYALEEKIIGSGLDVQILSSTPEGVLLELMPYFHASEKKGRIELESLTTRIRLKPGTSCVIGGENTKKESLAHALFGYDSRQSMRDVAIVLSVDTGGE